MSSDSISKPRAGPVLFGLAIVAVVLGLGYTSDRNRSRQALESAYLCRSLGVAVIAGYSEAFEASGPSGVAERSKSSFATTFLKEIKSSTNVDVPVFFGKSNVLGATREMRAWHDVIAEPRGTWMSYQVDLGATRRTLDASIRLLEESAGSSEALKTAADARARTLVMKLENQVQAELEAARRAEEAAAAAAEKAEQERRDAEWRRDFVLRQKEREEARLADLRNATPTPTTEAVEQDSRRRSEERELAQQRRRLVTEWEAKFDAANEKVAIAAHKLRQQESAAPPVRLSDPPTPFETSAKKARDLQLEPYRSALDAAQAERGRLVEQRPPGAGNPYRDARRGQ